MSETDTPPGPPVDDDGADASVVLDGGRGARSDAPASAAPAWTPPDPGAQRPEPRSTTTPTPRRSRRRRRRKWDRPPPPHDWRWFVGGLGRILIAIGLLMFAFVAYQLYGTGIENAAAQNELEDEFDELLAEVTPAPAPAPSTTPPATQPPDEPPPTDPPVTDPPVVPVENQNLRQVEEGDALARIEIPRIDLDDIVVAGVDKNDLKRGPGHFPDTPVPGQLGNSAIAGHRTTYGQPFRDVDKLEAGDEIRITTLDGVFVYRVTGQEIVGPNDYHVVATTDPTRANLTLTSCHPVFTARERIIIFSELSPEESGPVGEPVLNYGRPTRAIDDPSSAAAGPTTTISSDATAPGTTSASERATPTVDADRLGTEAVNEGIADAFAESWFSDPGANSQVGLWGLAVSAIALASYLLSRRVRRDWVGLLVGLVPFTIALYFFFQNVNRLLPPNL